MRYPWIKKEDTHGYPRQSSLVARAGRVFGPLPGALPSPGGRGRLGALPDRAAHRIAHQELRHYGGGRPGTSEQRLQEVLTTMQWDEQDLNRQRVEKMIAEATVGQGVLIFDDTGFAKQGKASVGVARQYSGTLGKVGNCQVAVTCCYSDPHAD